MSSWNCSAVLDGQLYTHSRSHWPSTSAFCHSAEVGRTALSIEQFRSSAIFCGGPVDLEFAASLRDPELSLDTFKRQPKTYIFAKYWWQNVLSTLEIFLSMCYINLHFTLLYFNWGGRLPFSSSLPQFVPFLPLPFPFFLSLPSPPLKVEPLKIQLRGLALKMTSGGNDFNYFKLTKLPNFVQF